MNSSPIGSDVLSAPAAPPTVPGLDVLQAPSTSTTSSSSSNTPSSSSSPSSNSSTTSSSSASAQNPYMQSYDSLEQWSASYLMQAMLNGSAQGLPELTAGASASQFAQLMTQMGTLESTGSVDTTA